MFCVGLCIAAAFFGALDMTSCLRAPVAADGLGVFFWVHWGETPVVILSRGRCGTCWHVWCSLPEVLGQTRVRRFALDDGMGEGPREVHVGWWSS